MKTNLGIDILWKLHLDFKDKEKVTYKDLSRKPYFFPQIKYLQASILQHPVSTVILRKF